MKVRSRNFRKAHESQNFWPSFTDVMSTIVIVLFFIIFLAFFQQMITTGLLDKTKDELSVTQDELARKQSDLEQAGLELETRKAEIKEQEDLLRLMQTEAEELKAELEQGRQELTLSAQTVAEQQRIIANSNQELANLRAKLQDLSVLRVDILQRVKASIEEQMGTTTMPNGQPLISIDNNANLVINNNLLFATASSTLSADGEALLKRFAIAFERLLDDPEIREYIESINVEGHADTDADFDYNYRLSCDRANAVVIYMLKVNPSMEIKYGSYFAATGYSEFRPIDPGDSEAAKAKNRRIQFSITIKDSKVQSIIEEYLNDVSAAPDTVGG
jgi:chemotaxis protein MotB